MIRILLKISSPRKALVLFGVFIVMELLFSFVLVPPVEGYSGLAIPDMRLGLGYQGYRSALDALHSGRALSWYRGVEALDMVFPLAYALALASIIGSSLKALDREHGLARFLLLLPVFAAAFDYAENVLIMAMLSIHPGEYPAAAAAASAMTWAKFSFFVASVGISLALGYLAVMQRSRPKAILTVRAPSPIGPYSQAVKTGRFVFVSGQLGIDPESGELSKGVEAQAERALDNIEAILDAEGYAMSGIIKTTIFLVDMKDFALVNGCYAKRFSGVMPARSTVQVAALPKGGLVEIEAIARLR
jgi:2-iminobutanoate/2-iminopropanoate deaminase